MKKNVLFALAITFGLAALLASCLKETEPALPAAQTEADVTTDAGASDRWDCSKTVTIYGAAGTILCGNIPGSNCNGCAIPFNTYGQFAIEYNTLTTTMLGSCFLIRNPTLVTKNVSFSASGGIAICAADPATSIPPGETVSFCITKQGNCCKVTVSVCE